MSTWTSARLLGVAAVSAAAVLGPVAVAASTGSDAVITEAAPGKNCLAWLGARGTGTCISWSNGSPVNVGTPGVGLGNGGIYSGPLAPGSSFSGTIPMG
ncbi:DUF7155 family protein [Mycolicibacterium brumae]|uniref:Uncharacterized protein n=1 Tax=Mycolicibacterium brumae TaxID=85968 RepID=A0A2G5P864_9MYCO|nr:hypothetical protein [Mycolicibacterium brumae]MCV7194741.1 hypothetical protein [Mycolicibacterium brumae]PIB74290.1 hypothetical protein CQY22_013555 [Mycolicibacterium brumae]RWA15157.1 hypothetical protein MBRU_11090 [Mycolicibacterium brumae DSM 44177]UWW08225.1 hypothetical protein L2Z93_001271 [Mycolicibacterium brumae]